jgi:hypothetical protein
MYGGQMSIIFLKIPPLIAALSSMNLVHIVRLGFSNVHFNIISHLPFVPFRVSYQQFDCRMYFM